tara:strand:+ start:848 stop:1498 length:651 start_codon:yes stop_codon:yes gene_type:complete
MFEQTNKLKNYSKLLEGLYESFVGPALEGKQKGTPLFEWESPPPFFGSDILSRCDYNTYKLINESGLKISPANDAIALSYSNYEPAIAYLNEIIDTLGKQVGVDNLGLSNKPLCYEKYKDYNGFMGWHTNHDYPGDRWYFVYNTDSESSFFRCIDPDTKQMITEWEPKGWSLNHFTVGDSHKPLWHCVYTKSSRISFGIRSLPSLGSHKWKNVILM